jgi:hypothetical protein
VWESGGIAPPFLTSVLNGGEWSARLGETALDTQWVGLRAGLDSMEMRQISFLCRKCNPSRPDHSPVAILTELSQFPKHYYRGQIKSGKMTGHITLIHY